MKFEFEPRSYVYDYAILSSHNGVEIFPLKKGLLAVSVGNQKS
jgi:hypothetical protein